MISTKNLKFLNFKKKIFSSVVKNELKLLLGDKENEVINSLKLSYKYSYSNKFLNKFKNKFSSIRLIGMGGSILGTKAINSFLNSQIKKKSFFLIIYCHC